MGLIFKKKKNVPAAIGFKFIQGKLFIEVPFSSFLFVCCGGVYSLYDCMVYYWL